MSTSREKKELNLKEHRVSVKSRSQEPESHLGTEVIKTGNNTETVIHLRESPIEEVSEVQ